MSEAEFVRGNQKNYIRILCNAHVTESYEYRMCINNGLNSLLSFQQRAQNGKDYLYYEISGMQSLDVLLQTQKLKRSLAIMIAKAVVKLCREFSEYVLDIRKVIWEPKYIMVQVGSEEFKFVYDFGSMQNVAETSEQTDMEQFWECCIEYLDYQDELLMEQMFRVYEAFLDQKDNFTLLQEMESMLNKLLPSEEKEATEQMVEEIPAADPFIEEGAVSEVIKLPEKSKVYQSEWRKKKLGLGVLLCLNILTIFVWKPLTLLKLFFSIAAGGVLLWLNIHVRRQERRQEKELHREQEQAAYREEYEEVVNRYDGEMGETCMIAIADNRGVLYNLQNCEPQYIYIGENRKIIGKDPEKAQIQLVSEGVSRVHAMVYKDGTDCVIEDLNSTNGTWVNGKGLEPREPYILKEGDKIRFAGSEYIFR